MFLIFMKKEVCFDGKWTTTLNILALYFLMEKKLHGEGIYNNKSIWNVQYKGPLIFKIHNFG